MLTYAYVCYADVYIRQHALAYVSTEVPLDTCNRLLASSQRRDGLVSSLLKQYTLYIVPNMCPDGAFRGQLPSSTASLRPCYMPYA